MSADQTVGAVTIRQRSTRDLGVVDIRQMSPINATLRGVKTAPTPRPADPATVPAAVLTARRDRVVQSDDDGAGLMSADQSVDHDLNFITCLPTGN